MAKVSTPRSWQTQLWPLIPLVPFLAALWLLLVPVFLITTNVRIAFASPGLYVAGFDRYDVSGYTGISRLDLVRIAGEIRDYFGNDEEFLTTHVRIRGADRALFNERELEHMRDVKALVSKVSLLNKLAWVYLALFMVAGFWLGGRLFGPRLAKLMLWGGLGTIGLGILAGLAFLVAFDQLFILFHQLSFANDFWQLDPSRDYLVALFPEGFWFDTTMLIAFATLLEAVAVAATGGFVLWRTRHRATPNRQC